MDIIVKVYWIRMLLGVVAALICFSYIVLVPGMVSKEGFPLVTFLNSLSIALLIYLISFYAIKNVYLPKMMEEVTEVDVEKRQEMLVQKTRKLATTGIFMYFITWLVFFVLLYTIIANQLP